MLTSSNDISMGEYKLRCNQRMRCLEYSLTSCRNSQNSDESCKDFS